MATIKTLDYPLDYNGSLRLEIEPPDENGLLHARLYSSASADSTLVRNILPLLRFHNAGSFSTPETPDFTLKAPDKNKHITLTVNGMTLAELSVADGTVLNRETAHARHKLCVFDTRSIGRMQPGILSANLSAFQVPCFTDPSAFSDYTPITDLHTHFSVQMPAEDLIAMGIRHKVPYPVAALRMLGIATQEYYDRKKIVPVRKRLFWPLAHLQSPEGSEEDAVAFDALTNDAHNAILKAMRLSTENQSTFGMMERCYYLREPFTKNVSLLGEVLESIAMSYKRQGIVYAEGTSTEVLNTEWLGEIHRVLPAIEAKHGVQLRFKAGLPRNLSDELINYKIDQYECIAASPYIVGIDLIGYEINKPSKLKPSLDKLALCMKRHQDSPILQIHAGENSKNLDNVKEALKFADEHGLRLHLGHSMHGVDEEAMEYAVKLAGKGDIIAQFNLDSNLALNNIDFPNGILKGFIRNGIPCILGSDGSDIYSTDARQIAQAASYGGLERADFKAMHDCETAYIQRQQAIFNEKYAAYAQHTSFAAFLYSQLTLPAMPQSRETQKISVTMDDALETLIRPDSGRIPVFFGGAGGKSWKNVPKESQRQFAIVLGKLLRQLDPAKTYLVKGRTKKTVGGVNTALEQAITEYNAEHPATPFHCVTLLAESEEEGNYTTDPFHTKRLDTPLMGLTETVVQWLKIRNGMAFYIGGNNFTRDLILLSSDAASGIPFGIMPEAGGASSDKARIYPANAFRGQDGMLTYAKQLASRYAIDIFR